jgi:hypothetical protein
MWQPSPSHTERIVECEQAHMTVELTAKALGIKPKELVEWRHWLAHWAPLYVAPDMPRAAHESRNQRHAKQPPPSSSH